MSSNFFNCLTTLQQADYLSSQGYYMHTRKEPGFIVDMYQLPGLYVEIYFDKTEQDFVFIKSMYPTENPKSRKTNTENFYLFKMSIGSYCYYNC